MPSDVQLEVYRQFRAAQEKYSYFLLTAAGAAIALVVNQTQGTMLAYSQLPLAAAVVLWAISFYCGCRHLSSIESSLFANHALLIVEAGDHPDVGQHPQRIGAASEGIREAMDSHSRTSLFFARWQFRCLLLGAACYVGWHIYEMWLLSLSTTSTPPLLNG